MPQGEPTETSLKRRGIQKKVGDTLTKYHEALSIADEKGDTDMAAAARNAFIADSIAIEGGPPGLNWGDPYSQPTFKHAFLHQHGHGQRLEDKRMIDRAREMGCKSAVIMTTNWLLPMRVRFPSKAPASMTSCSPKASEQMLLCRMGKLLLEI